MKTKIFNSVLTIAFLGLLVSQCTNDDQPIPDQIVDEVNQNELISVLTSTAPTIDGTVDVMWDEATAITSVVEVPDPGNDVFQGYEGDSYTVHLRSMYDANNIYFLAEWDDRTFSFNRQTWYFDPSDNRWKQEDRVPLFNASGNMTRQAFYEDKFAMLWNVGNSITNFSCYSSCHTDLSEADGFARHYTNSASETVDMWHWKGARTNVNDQADDQYQDNVFPNGRHGDEKDSGGYSNNKQDLQLDGTGATVTVPKYFIPSREYYYWITQSEIDAGTAKLITAVASDGTLTYSGGTVDPSDARFQREGSTTGAYCMPSIYTEPFVGNRGDLTARGEYTGSGWVLEIKRALDTGDAAAQDIDFSDLSDQPFGIGVFDNAGIAHAIKAGLTLKFEE